jgi:hypothetical protein
LRCDLGRFYSLQGCTQIPFELACSLIGSYHPVDGFAIALLGLTFADLEQLSRLDGEFLNARGHERVDVHRAIVGQGVLDAIPVPALDPYAVRALQSDFDWDVGLEAHHLAAADRYSSVLVDPGFRHG